MARYSATTAGRGQVRLEEMLRAAKIDLPGTRFEQQDWLEHQS